MGHLKKYHVERCFEKHRWHFGIVNIIYKPVKYYMTLVENRSANVLLPIIKKHYIEGTIIWSDQWKSYNNLENMRFVHSTVNHKFNFVNPETGFHTQNIESLLNKLKLRLKNLKCEDEFFLKDYICEWMCKDNISSGRFTSLYKLL